LNCAKGECHEAFEDTPVEYTPTYDGEHHDGESHDGESSLRRVRRVKRISKH